MNDEQVRGRARERRLSADLSAALEASLVAIDAVESEPARRRGSLLVAAMLALGVTVAFGVSQLRGDHDEAQGRVFDPVDPWFSHEWPFRTPMNVLREPANVEALPEGASRFTITMRAQEGPKFSATLSAALRRPRVDELFLMMGDQQAQELPWAQIAAHDELRSMMMYGPQSGVDAAAIRELRRLANLQTLALMEIGAPLDVAFAESLVELPMLRQLTCANVRATPAGVAALAGLPNLDTLILNVDGDQTDVDGLLAGAARVRTLRALVFEGSKDEADAASLQPLHRLPHLVHLGLSHVAIDDEAIAALPTRLESLFLPALYEASAKGVASLAQLRRLRSLSMNLPLRTEGMLEALCELLRALPIECFDARASLPDEQLWRTLQSMPTLRRLELNTNSETLPAALAEARKCESLEVLWVDVEAVPEPEQLAPLRGHPTLRELCLIRYRPRSGVPTAAQLAALRDALGIEVEVR